MKHKKSFDPEGHMEGLEHWSPLMATQLAREEGIDELTEAHWHVIYAVRNLYRERGRSASARKVMEILEREFVDEGGRRYLYELFPKGPVSQGSRLAGVPVPPMPAILRSAGLGKASPVTRFLPGA